MGQAVLRNLTCWLMIAIFPASLWAADARAAMLYAKGTAWVNGASVPRSSAIFPGDLVQTPPESLAQINASGSNVMVLSNSLVKFEGNAVSIEHGGVSVATSKGMTTRFGEVTVTPVSSDWTEFEVTDVDGTVQVAARKGDVSVSDGQETATLPEGQQATVDDPQKKKKKRRKAGAIIPAGSGPWLSSPWAIGIGAAAVGGVTIWVLLQGDDPMSPKDP